ncbi:MAG: discoidin domain-containing protein, partial [Thermoguttaceae bacterium]
KSTLPIYGKATGDKNVYRNLAVNPNDVQGEPNSFPHATSNSEFAFMPEFAAKNAINGKSENKGHGGAFPSWGPNKRTDLWWKVEFGRPVEVDKVVITIRADFPHDAAWNSATIEFSDGTKERIKLEKTDKPQEFKFNKRTTDFVTITDLVQDQPLGWCGLTEVEVWGTDLK